MACSSSRRRGSLLPSRRLVQDLLYDRVRRVVSQQPSLELELGSRAWSWFACLPGMGPDSKPAAGPRRRDMGQGLPGIKAHCCPTSLWYLQKQPTALPATLTLTVTVWPAGTSTSIP